LAVDILIEDQHRALAFIAACNNQGYRPSANQVEDWLDEPATPTPYGLLGSGGASVAGA